GESEKSSQVPKKGSMSTVERGGSSSQARGRKNKEIARSDPIEEEASSASGSDSDHAPQKKKVKAPPKKKPPPSEILKLLNNMAFLPTAYPDPITLQRLGLYEDVRYMLEKMGLESLMALQRPGYELPTNQFIFSLDATFFSEEETDDGFGFIK